MSTASEMADCGICQKHLKHKLRELRRQENRYLRVINSYPGESGSISVIDFVRAVVALFSRLRRLEARVRKLEGD